MMKCAKCGKPARPYSDHCSECLRKLGQLTKAAYEDLNAQRNVADWPASDVFQFLLGWGLSETAARELTLECRPDSDDF